MENVETTLTTEPEPAEVEAVETEAAEPEIPEYRRMKHKVKVSDEGEEEIDYDELVKGYQKANVSTKRFEEAKRMRSEAETFLNQVKSNPTKALKELKATDAFTENPEALLDLIGKDAFVKLAEDVLYKEIQRQKMSPEQQELEDLKREKAEREAEAKKSEDEKKAAEDAEHVEGYRTSIEKTIVGALESSELPRNPETIARMSKLWLSSLENGYEPDPAELVEMVKESYQSEHKQLYSSMSAEQLYTLLGDDKMKELREYSLSKVKSPTGTRNQAASPRQSSNSEKMTLQQLMEHARRNAGL